MGENKNSNSICKPVVGVVSYVLLQGTVGVVGTVLGTGAFGFEPEALAVGVGSSFEAMPHSYALAKKTENFICRDRKNKRLRPR
jgi:hypothetical protein